jgi:adenylate kinase family enzyme
MDRRSASERIHVTGGPGSGKTTLARRIAARAAAPLYDLDDVALAASAEDGSIGEAPTGGLGSILVLDRCLTEGAYIESARQLLEAADLIVLMSVPWRVASYRIVMRHVRAEIAGTNRFPGWRRLYRFWRWSARFYGDRNPHSLNQYGVPNTQALAAELLKPYSDKLVVCATSADEDAILTRL